jgi:hypothetical protein
MTVTDTSYRKYLQIIGCEERAKEIGEYISKNDWDGLRKYLNEEYEYDCYGPGPSAMFDELNDLHKRVDAMCRCVLVGQEHIVKLNAMLRKRNWIIAVLVFIVVILAIGFCGELSRN